MDNINDIISSLSNDDIEMLKGVASSILSNNEQGQNNTQKNTSPVDNNNNNNMPDISSILSGLNMTQNASNTASNANAATSALSNLNINADDFKMMMKAKTIFDKMNNSKNKNVDLILALMPHLSEHTRGKADDALRIIRLFDVLPMLKDLF